MSKHTTDRGVNNSLRGFFERVLKPYISNLFTSEATDASGRYKMDYVGTYGNLAVFKKKIPAWDQGYNNDNGSKFVIERNKQVIFDSSTISGNTKKPFVRKAVPENAKNFSTLNSLLSDYAFPLNTSNDNNIFINPGDGSTQNVFSISRSSNTETYDGEVLPIGSIKINNVFNLRSFKGYSTTGYSKGYYFSTIEDRPENCGLYGFASAESFALKERILDIAQLREKLVEVLETTDEELETKITSIRILDVAHCVHTGYYTSPFKAYCMLLEVNKNKLVSIYSYIQTSGATFSDNVKQIDVFDIPSQVEFAQFRADAFSCYTYNSYDTDRYGQVFFGTYLETPIVTTDNHVYRFVFDPIYDTVNETTSTGKNHTVVKAADKATVTFQEVDLGDFTFNGAIDIINCEAEIEGKDYANYDYRRGNSYVATSKGLILFNTLSNSRQVTSVTVFKPEILNGFTVENIIRSTNNSKIIKIRDTQGAYAGFLAVSSTYNNLSWTYSYYSPDGIHWFDIGSGTNKLQYTLYSYSSEIALYGPDFVSNKDLRGESINLETLMGGDYNKFMQFVFYNKKEVNKLNLDLNNSYSYGNSEVEAFYLIEARVVGKFMPEIKRK
jgi:hypothetical protein